MLSGVSPGARSAGAGISGMLTDAGAGRTATDSEARVAGGAKAKSVASTRIPSTPRRAAVPRTRRSGRAG